MTSPMLTPEALDAMRWMQPQADAAAFLAAQDREWLHAHGVARFYDEHGRFPTDRERSAMRTQIDALMDEAA
jgi:hypothetical protein